MSHTQRFGGSFRPFQTRYTEAGGIYYRFHGGTIGGMEADNAAHKNHALEIGWNPKDEPTKQRMVWLEIGFALGGTYGATVQSVTLKDGENFPTAKEWPHYPQQWDFENTLTARLTVAVLLSAPLESGWTIQAQRRMGKSLVLLAPIVQTCNVVYPIWSGGSVPGSYPTGGTADKRGFFFCEADPYNPAKPLLFNPDGLLFS